MRYLPGIDNGRLLSGVAVCLCTVAVSVSATALEASLSTGMTPTPPGDSPNSGLSLLYLLFLLLQSILSVFGISLSEWGTMPGTSGSMIQLGMQFLQLVVQYRVEFLLGVGILIVFGLCVQHRQRINVPNGITPPDNPTESPQTRMTDLRASSSNAVDQAWREMIRNVDLDDPHTRTPREWETAAIEGGFNPAAVATITELFVTTQYGAGDVTPKRRREAQNARSELTREETIDQ